MNKINFISDIKSENERLLCEIDEIKIKIQKYLEESNVAKEKFEAIKNVNIELQNNVEKLQKKLDEKKNLRILNTRKRKS